MILSGVDNDVLLGVQPTLANYYPQGQTTWDIQITEATRQIVRELKKNKRDLKKFCTPLPLQASKQIAVDFESDLVTDEIDRMICKVTLTEYNVDCSFILYGTNDSGISFDEIGTLAFTETGTKYLLFNNTYKQYKLKIITTDTTTYKADLYESSFYHAQLWLSLSLCFKALVKAVGDRFDYLSTDYFNRYQDEMNSMVATYDEDGSGDISETYETVKATAVEFKR